MKQKTAMMELIEMISYTSKDTFHAMEDSGFFKQLLEKEKEQIIEAYDKGRYSSLQYNKTPSEYYNQTYLEEK